MQTFNERKNTMNMNNVITFENSARDHGDLLTGVRKTSARKLIEQAVQGNFQNC